MDVFQWTDERSGIRWSVTVRVRPPGAVASPGTAIVRFEAKEETREVDSPLHPGPEDDDVLAELVDLAVDLSSDAEADARPE